ncbi:hypothetical protein EDB85DRAFT_2136367 [Lactarius pseudohatsudake]|nr:hypothetical protein EDB85DRAFT_2136367 [Lactarius pseudohatsudake]
MPHKRAKRSARQQQRKERGADLAPPGAGSSTTLSTEGIPKSISRVLDAAKIRTEYRQKKRARQLEEGTHDGDDGDSAPTLAKGKKRRRVAADSDAGKSSTIEIQPGESLKHFNRRVEDHMRPLVRSAMLASAATERKERKAATTPRESKARSSVGKAEGTTTTTPSTAAGGDKHRDRPKEFATISSARPRRLNDIATAPPELKNLPRRRASDLGAKHARTKAVGSGLSMAQRAMMETERENAIRRYREMKERKAKDERRTDGPSRG